MRAITDPAAAERSGIPHAAALLGLADALVGGDDAALAAAREAVEGEMGAPALVDAVAVASNFERMVRIADATGIPLDPPVAALSEGVRRELDLDRFAAAANTPAVGAAARLLMRAVRPVIAPLLRRASRRLAKLDAPHPGPDGT